MKENKNETKYLITSHAFDDALILLLDQKEYEFINVKDICKKAGFNRSTFYLHYSNIDELLKETIEYQNEKFFNYFNNEKIDIKNTALKDLNFINEKYLLPYLKFIKDNQVLMKIAYIKKDLMESKKTFLMLYQYIFEPILTRFNIKEEYKKYTLRFYMDGVLGIINERIRSDFKMKEEELIKLIISFIPKINEEK